MESGQGAEIATCQGSVDLILQWSGSWIALVLQTHGIVPAILIGTFWYLAASARRREILRLQKTAEPNGRYEEEKRKKGSWPGVSIILPLRGYHKYSIQNWKAVLGFHYEGELEYFFVVEDVNEPAICILRDVLQNFACQNFTWNIVYAGKASSCSQKIHNLEFGIKKAKKSNTYILCLDDDVQPHSTFLKDLVADLESMPEAHVATAYPFDIPDGPMASLFTYATLAYHLPLSVGLAINSKTRFVWGGCMAFRMSDMESDRLGILQDWVSGGYSDDLTVAARMNKLGLDVYCPTYAVFPQWLNRDIKAHQYWNYLRRQLFVLDTYADPHNRRTNYSLACLLLYGSVGFIAPTIIAGLRLAFYLLEIFSPLHCINTNRPSDFIFCASILIFLLSVFYMACGLSKMIAETASLLSMLHPEFGKECILQCFCWWKLAIGFWVAFAASPLCLLYTFCTGHIVWSGVEYRRRSGKVFVKAHRDSPILK